MVKVAWISTFRTQCGLATYIEYLLKPLSKLVEIKIFSEKIFSPFTETEPILQNKDILVNHERCWDRRDFAQGNYKVLQEKIIEYSPDILHLNFVAGIFAELNYNPNSPFQNFIKNLRDNGIKIVMTLHDIPISFPDSKQLSNWYRNLDAKFIVFNPDTVKALQRWCSKEKIFLIPHATWDIPTIAKKEARQKLKLKEEDFLLVQIGFYGIDKGMEELISAIPKIPIKNIKLVFAGGFLYPIMDVNKVYIQNCIKLALRLNLQNKVVFLGKFLSDEEIDLWCSAADFLVLNSKMPFAYSTSGSIHRIMSAGKPILLNDNPRLSEFIDGTNCIKMTNDTIVEKLISLYNDNILQEKIVIGIIDYSKQTTFDIIARKYLEMYQK